MNTRQPLARLIGVATVLLSLAPARAGGQPAGRSDMNFVDAHVHVWTPDIERYPLAAGYSKADMQPPSFTPEELFRHARPAGVTRINLIQMSFYGFDNSFLLE